MITMIVLYFVNLLHPLLQEEMLASIQRSAFILKFKGYTFCYFFRISIHQLSDYFSYFFLPRFVLFKKPEFDFEKLMTSLVAQTF